MEKHLAIFQAVMLHGVQVECLERPPYVRLVVASPVLEKSSGGGQMSGREKIFSRAKRVDFTANDADDEQVGSAACKGKWDK